MGSLCDQAAETIPHLLSGCPFSRQVWHDIPAWCRLQATIPSEDVPFLDWLASSATGIPSCLRRGFTWLALLITWWIWKQRNACVFDAARPSVSMISATIKGEARCWARTGALGLCNILPKE
ncbi:uncharacterized protein [Aegilops tauschii subsp. strangulata]|uniref:uncharacterized protein n=1 Tax=Aegilops tauschii subsp. strangulata TaxID=200361 RepID=UPI003CC88561